MKRHCIYTWQVSADRHGRAEAEARTSIVCVAENRNVCHSFDRWPTSAASVSAKPTSKRRSASSSTSTRTPDGRRPRRSAQPAGRAERQRRERQRGRAARTSSRMGEMTSAPSPSCAPQRVRTSVSRRDTRNASVMSEPVDAEHVGARESGRERGGLNGREHREGRALEACGAWA
jgi:hypothetical protein